jgi:hypothetical protein
MSPSQNRDIKLELYIKMVLVTIISTVVAGLIIPILGNPFISGEHLLPSFLRQCTDDTKLTSIFKGVVPPALIILILTFILSLCPQKIHTRLWFRVLVLFFSFLVGLLLPFLADI